MQYYSALDNDIDIIISRDNKGFKNTKIPVMSNKEFIVKLDEFNELTAKWKKRIIYFNQKHNKT